VTAAEPLDPARELRQLVETGRFREALGVHERTRDPAVRGRPEVALLAATAATRVGEFGQGVMLAETALERFRARADADGRMRAQNLLGAIAFENGRLDTAERAFGEALELAQVLGDTRMIANASNNLASVAHLRGRPDLALSLWRAALLAYQRQGDRRGTAQTWHNLGLAFRDQQEWERAEAAALEAVRHAEQVGEPTLVALAIMGRAETHIERDELALAARELDRAEERLRSADDPVGQVDIGRLRARLALRAGLPEQAASLALAARAAAAARELLQLEAECAATAAIALHRLGRMEESARERAAALVRFARLGATALQDALLRALPA
jgi:Flp pilus assembly protein TadD